MRAVISLLLLLQPAASCTCEETLSTLETHCSTEMAPDVTTPPTSPPTPVDWYRVPKVGAWRCGGRAPGDRLVEWSIGWPACRRRAKRWLGR